MHSPVFTAGKAGPAAAGARTVAADVALTRRHWYLSVLPAFCDSGAEISYYSFVRFGINVVFCRACLQQNQNLMTTVSHHSLYCVFRSDTRAAILRLITTKGGATAPTTSAAKTAVGLAFSFLCCLAFSGDI